MKKSALLTAVLSIIGVVQAHTLFLKPDRFVVGQDEKCQLRLLNGTFDQSENTITRDRMVDVSIIFPNGERFHPPLSAWRDEGLETVLDLPAKQTGTYLAGVSTAPSLIELEAREFDEYLEHDGIIDLLKKRRETGSSRGNVVERYAKHVKAVVQSGDMFTDSYREALGYPVEILPLQNPYQVAKGDLFRARILGEGAPLPGQLVYAGFASFKDAHEDLHHHDQLDTERHDHYQEDLIIRADEQGIVEFPIAEEGLWYVRFIRMTESSEPGIDYESNWATLTFAVFFDCSGH